MRYLFLMLIAITSLTSKAYKYDFNVDDIYYTISPFEDVVAVTSGDNKYFGNVIIPDSVTYEGIVYRVTGIENEAFRRCENLTSVKIPLTVIGIGAEAFYGCTLLTSIHIPNSVKSIGRAAFENTGWYNNQPNGILYLDKCCLGYKGINTQKRISIAAGTRVIGAYAFKGYKDLTSVIIPNSVKTIGKSAFRGCEALTTIKIPNSVSSIGAQAFEDCVGLTSINIPNSVTSIGNQAFHRCGKLKSVNITDLSAWSKIKFHKGRYNDGTNPLSNGGVLKIKGIVVKDLIIPDGITEINDFAFQGCIGLTSVTIPNSVTSIGVAAFGGCNNLISVTIPNSVTTIGDGAFGGCKSLKSVNITNLANWCKIIFESRYANPLYYAHSIKVNDTEITDLFIPDGITEINDFAFSGCTSLTSVTIPNSVTIIGNAAFYECAGLTSVTIPNSVLSIGENAFENTGWYNTQPNGILYLDNCCLGYKGEEPTGTLNITEGTRLIGDGAFCFCSQITEVSLPNSVTSIGTEAFKNTRWYNTQPNGILYLDNCCLGYKGEKPTGTLNITEGTRLIGNSAFDDCDNLTHINIPNTVKNISPKAFENTGWHNNQPNGILYLDNCCLGYKGEKPTGTLNITEGTRLIGDGAFANCTELRKINIPNSIKTISTNSFIGFIGLVEFTHQYKLQICLNLK